MLFGLHAVTVHIFSCESNNVGIKFYISENVGKCECGNPYIKLLQNTTLKNYIVKITGKYGKKTLIEISGI